MKDAIEKQMAQAAKWAQSAPTTDELFQVTALCAMSRGDGTITNEVSEKLYGFIRQTLFSLAVIPNVIRGHLALSIKDGELAFSLTESGTAKVQAAIGEDTGQA